jgi:two-component sensor histidine kinase
VSELVEQVLDELATNAVKYGALSNAAGMVTITWHVADQQIVLRWQESGGSPVRAPEHKGFGSTLIEQVSHGKTKLEFAVHGLGCTIQLPLANVGGQ